MVFQDNLGWPFSTQLKWINNQILDWHGFHRGSPQLARDR
jgi:hypothetical protein